MLHKDYSKLGHVVKPFSFRGELIIHIDSDNPRYYHKLESVFIEINQKLVPFFISAKQQHNKPEFLRLKLEGIDNEQKAQELNGADIYIHNRMLPKGEKQKFRPQDLIGFTIIENSIELGEISDYYDFSNNPILAFNYQGHEVLLPFNMAFLKGIDVQNKLIEVNLPEGLIELYTSQHENDEE